MTNAVNLASVATSVNGTINAAQINSTASGTPPVFADSAGSQQGTLCRAWVNFAGSSGTRNGYFNVSSVTRNSAANYTVNFTNAFADANYAAIPLIAYNSGNSPYATAVNAQTLSAGSYTFSGNGTNNGGSYDPTVVSVAIFR